MESFISFLDSFGTVLTLILFLIDYWRRKRKSRIEGGNNSSERLFVFNKKAYTYLILIFVLTSVVFVILKLISSTEEEFSEFVLYFKFILRVVWVIAGVYFLMGQFYPKLLNTFSLFEKKG